MLILFWFTFFDKQATFVVLLRNVNMGRQIVPDGLLERFDTELLFFWARRHIYMCLICAHVAHQAHWQNFEKKCRILMIFRGSEIVLKNLPKFIFAKTPVLV